MDLKQAKTGTKTTCEIWGVFHPDVNYHNKMLLKTDSFDKAQNYKLPDDSKYKTIIVRQKIIREHVSLS